MCFSYARRLYSGKLNNSELTSLVKEVNKAITISVHLQNKLDDIIDIYTFKLYQDMMIEN